MANWDNKFTTDIKLDPSFKALKSLLMDGTIKSITSFIDYSPTKIASLLRMSYKSYHLKIHEPWKFSLEQILLLSYIIDIDPKYIFDIIQSESQKHIKGLASNYVAKLKQTD